MTYVDGFVLPVPKNKIAQYRKMAADGGRMWKKHGALQYFECVGDDLTPNMKEMGNVKIVHFPKMAKAKPNETVFFSFIVYRSKAHRNSVIKKVMKEMKKHEEKYKNMEMPFDVRRMAYGGFRALVKT